MKKPFEQLTEFAKSHYTNDDPAHDFAHVMRVVSMARRLGESVGANLDILLPAALLHDVVNLPKNHPDRARASALAADEARRVLHQAGYETTAIEQIVTAIREHSYSRGDSPSSLESAVLQDADRLDALGAIGTMRMVAVGTQLKRVFYDSEDPMAQRRLPDDKQFTIDHFGTKLFKLVDKMNTEAGRLEAQKRSDFMKEFLRELENEIQGEIS